jgi:RNA-directed DNA polymerase
MRRKQQETSGFKGAGLGEAQEARNRSAELCVAKDARESLGSETLIEEVLARENLQRALLKVRSNDGAPGVDGMTVDQLPLYLKDNWLSIRDQILKGIYQPQPVKRVEIPKPDGGVRKLGIPTVLDRLIQQAILQILQPKYDPTFSPYSYGFRPGKSAHQAVEQAQSYIQQGYTWVVDIDLEKFFDRVNHDRLMARLAEDILDKRMLKLIRAFLTSGILEGGFVSPSSEGTPQGGPLSPLLSNVVLDELDRELSKRGYRFVRYADDENIYVKSETAGRRVMDSVTKFITKRLKLKVNEEKSAVDRPWNRKFLGFTFTSKDKRRKVAPRAIERFKDKVRFITRRTRGRSLEQVIAELRTFIRGWMNYFKYAETKQDFKLLDSWIRRKLRCLVWKQWQRSGTRYRNLCKHGVIKFVAWVTSKSGRGPWRLSNSPAMLTALTGKWFSSLGLPSLRMLHSQR